MKAPFQLLRILYHKFFLVSIAEMKKIKKKITKINKKKMSINNSIIIDIYIILLLGYVNKFTILVYIQINII